MNFSAPFIKRPIATTLLTAGVVLSGIAAFRELPVSPLPQVDFPTINVSAQLPGASPPAFRAQRPGGAPAALDQDQPPVRR